MKATGIVRRIDDLGRVVIPKEIRRTLRIREGDPLEIFTNGDGEIVFKKYSPIGELGLFAMKYAKALAGSIGHTVCVTDRDQIIAASGLEKRELNTKSISKSLEKLIDERGSLMASSREKAFIDVIEEPSDFTAQAISPIICEGDAIGSVVITTKENNAQFGEKERQLCSFAADFLGRQMEN